MLKKCKYLLSLFVGLSCLFCFSFADNYSLVNRSSFGISSVSDPYLLNAGSCLQGNSYTNLLTFTDSNGNIVASGLTISSSSTVCFDIDVYVTTTRTQSGTFNYYDNSFLLLGNNCPESSCSPVYLGIDNQGATTDYLLTGSDNVLYLGYGLTYSANLDDNGSYDFTVNASGSGDGFSQLFINDLEFPGVPLINVNIPDYIQRDYTTGTGQFDLYVGSGYDQDYIDSILKINSYRPDTKDFTNIFVSGLTLIFPYIFVALLIFFIWKLLKRIFR